MNMENDVKKENSNVLESEYLRRAQSSIVDTSYSVYNATSITADEKEEIERLLHKVDDIVTRRLHLLLHE